jgi:isocitrate dehydrogenase
LIYAWTGALRKRGELDGITELVTFADSLESTIIECIEDGYMTGDLAQICDPPAVKVLDSIEFLDELASRLSSKLGRRK